jgi:hypothetical protein
LVVAAGARAPIGGSMRNRGWSGGLVGVITGALLGSMQFHAAEAAARRTLAAGENIKQAIQRTANNVQIVTFPDTQQSSVRVVRGNRSAANKDAQRKSPDTKAEMAEIVNFGGVQNYAVRVLRGETDRAMATGGGWRARNGLDRERVSFADPRDRPVDILRGSVAQMPGTELFALPPVAHLDRIAFAVDGAESSHGADLAMWRPEPSAPQGPMQVSAAAAIDAGGGDRFNLAENRALGRAYLARMYRRYGNWADAIAAYNWGPGNVDTWIGGGRAADKVPLAVERYRDRVLRDAALPGLGVPFAAAPMRVPRAKDPQEPPRVSNIGWP